MKFKIPLLEYILICCFMLTSCSTGVLSLPKYITEGELVYYYFPDAGGGTKRLVSGADGNTFKQLSTDYGKDNSTVYYRKTDIKADPHTFELLSHGFAKDKFHIYRGGINQGDPETVVIINKKAYIDKENSYYFYERLNPDFSLNNTYYLQDWITVKSETELLEKSNNTSLVRKVRNVRKSNGYKPLSL